MELDSNDDAVIQLPSEITDWEGPPVQAVVCSAAEGYAIAWTFDENNGLSRVLRAGKMATKQGVFDEFGAALQFANYFGENWSAFEECINDLDWIEAPAYLLVIVHAEQLLSASPDRDVEIFFEILTKASDHWEHPEAHSGYGDRSPRPFHVVLQISADRIEALESLRARAQVPLPLIDVGDFIDELEQLRAEALRASRAVRAAAERERSAD